MADRIYVAIVVGLITLGTSAASAALYSMVMVAASFAAGAFRARRR